MNEKGGLLKGIITIIVWLIVVCSVSFATYVYIVPEPVVIEQKVYATIEQDYYNVDENELNGSWLQMHQYTVDKSALNKYEDLKEYYKGRDNPFGSLEGIREEIIEEVTPTIPDVEEELPLG